MSDAAPILLFDGRCALCSWTVRLVLRFDRRRAIRFAALESPAGRALLATHPELDRVDSIVLIEASRATTRSTAVLRLARLLGGAFRLLMVGYLIPREIRDSLYDVIAFWRHRWFGRYDTCPVPPPEARDRFLPDGW